MRSPLVWIALALALVVVWRIVVPSAETPLPATPKYTLVMAEPDAPLTHSGAGSAGPIDPVSSASSGQPHHYTAGRRLKFVLRAAAPSDAPVQVVVYGGSLPNFPFNELNVEMATPKPGEIDLFLLTGLEAYVPPLGTAELIFVVGSPDLARPDPTQVSGPTPPQGFERYRVPVFWHAPEEREWQALP
jgi:hypothetical protein